MKRYPSATEVVWCQEEPQNQGAWYQTAHYFRENMRDDQKLYYAGRPRLGLARRRLHGEAQRAAEGAGRAGFRKVQVVLAFNPARYSPGFSSTRRMLSGSRGRA